MSLNKKYMMTLVAGSVLTSNVVAPLNSAFAEEVVSTEDINTDAINENKNEVVSTEDISLENTTENKTVENKTINKDNKTVKSVDNNKDTTTKVDVKDVLPSKKTDNISVDKNENKNIIKDKPPVKFEYITTEEKDVKTAEEYLGNNKDKNITEDDNIWKNPSKNNVTIKTIVNENKVKENIKTNNIKTNNIKTNNIKTNIFNSEDSKIIYKENVDLKTKLNELKKSESKIKTVKEQVQLDLTERKTKVLDYQLELLNLENDEIQLNKELRKIEKAIKINNDKIKKLTIKRDKLSKNLMDLKKDLDENKSEKIDKLVKFKNRLVELQKNKELSSNILEKSNSFTDIKVKLTQINNLSKNDKKVINDIEKLDKEFKKKELKSKKMILELDKDAELLKGIQDKLKLDNIKKKMILNKLENKKINIDALLVAEEKGIELNENDLANLTKDELNILNNINDTNALKFNTEYKDYLEQVKKKRNHVEKKLEKEKSLLGTLETHLERLKKDGDTDSNRYNRLVKVISELKETIKINETYLKEKKYLSTVKVGEYSLSNTTSSVGDLSKRIESERELGDVSVGNNLFNVPAHGVFTSGFGYRNLFGYNEFHSGIDIANTIGTDIRASQGGIVKYAGAIDNGYGNVIVIEHNIDGKTYTTLYGHLSAVGVKAGDVVKQDELIGLMGNAGRSTGPHLHFEIYESKKSDWGYSGVVNPFKYISKSDI